MHWLIHKINSPQEVITFQADLDAPPAFSLQMQNFRWFARSSSKTEIENAGWQFERLPSVMITTKPEYPKRNRRHYDVIEQRRQRRFPGSKLSTQLPKFLRHTPAGLVGARSPGAHLPAGHNARDGRQRGILLVSLCDKPLGSLHPPSFSRS